MSILNIPKVFQDDDTVYHYTTSEIALLHILKHMKLRLSPRADSIDPIENTKETISYSSSEYDNILIKIGKEISTELKNAKQLSFCKNKLYDIKEGIPTNYSFEKYGFAKPRMWDNFGDKYKGVCLAFSKKKLKETILNTTFFDNNEDDIEYLTYKEFSIRHHSISWQGSREKTHEVFRNIFKKRLFYKHVDYSMENEYRICSLSKEQYDFIDIRDSLIGLILSNQGVNEYLYDGFSRFMSNNEHLHYLIISFYNRNISVKTYKKRMDKIERINIEFNRQKNDE